MTKKAKEAKIGRPRTGVADKPYPLRLSDALMRHARAAAVDAGVPFSDWLRAAVTEKLGR